MVSTTMEKEPQDVLFIYMGMGSIPVVNLYLLQKGSENRNEEDKRRLLTTFNRVVSLFVFSIHKSHTFG